MELSHKTFDQYMSVKEFLEEKFHRPMDLVVMSALKPSLRATILRKTAR